MEHKNNPGDFTTDGKSYLNFYAANGTIAIKKLQLEGKKRLGVEEFLRGYRM